MVLFLLPNRVHTLVIHTAQTKLVGVLHTNMGSHGHQYFFYGLAIIDEHGLGVTVHHLVPKERKLTLVGRKKKKLVGWNSEIPASRVK
jgi:hypothetical protein